MTPRRGPRAQSVHRGAEVQKRARTAVASRLVGMELVSASAESFGRCPVLPLVQPVDGGGTPHLAHVSTSVWIIRILYTALRWTYRRPLGAGRLRR